MIREDHGLISRIAPEKCSGRITDSQATVLCQELDRYRKAEKLSVAKLSAEIDELTAFEYEDETLRRALNGTQVPDQPKLRAIAQFLAQRNAETANRSRLAVRAMASRDFLYGYCGGAQRPSIEDFAGHFSTPQSESGWTELELIPLDQSTALVSEFQFREGARTPAIGNAVLDAFGALRIEMINQHGFPYYYEHRGTVRDSLSGPALKLLLGRTGMPAELEDDTAQDIDEIFQQSKQGLLRFARIRTIEGQAEETAKDS